MVLVNQYTDVYIQGIECSAKCSSRSESCAHQAIKMSNFEKVKEHYILAPNRFPEQSTVLFNE